MGKRKSNNLPEYYEMNFTPKELLFVLFSKKVCPLCGEKLTRIKSMKKYEGVEVVRSIDYSYSVNMNRVTLQYKCEKCDCLYSFKELFELHKNKIS